MRRSRRNKIADREPFKILVHGSLLLPYTVVYL